MEQHCRICDNFCGTIYCRCCFYELMDRRDQLQDVVNELAKAHVSGGFIQLDAELAKELQEAAAAEVEEGDDH